MRASESTASIERATRDTGIVLRYTWADHGEPHAGTLLLQHDPRTGVLTAAWTDSWHQGHQLMNFRGSVSGEGNLELEGSYPSPPGPDWRWKIVLEAQTPDSLVLRMFNISPEGKSSLAVEATYRRA